MNLIGRKITGVAQRTTTATSATVALPKGAEAFSLCADQDCWVEFVTGSGVATVAATANAIYVPSKVVREVALPQGGPYTHLAAIRVSADGNLNIVGIG